MAQQYRYLYGPVPSRRLGLSCGVDIVPLKVCTLDCIYCQLGKTAQTNTERKDYAPIDEILGEIAAAVKEGLTADFLTIGGSGEPTLHLKLAELMDGIKALTTIPVALLTNGTVLHLPQVRIDCARADVVLPSLDAVDDATFQAINRPDPDITIENLIDGLCTFRKEYTGQIWLEIFLVEGLNTQPEHVTQFRRIIDRIAPDKIHLNTAVRPTTEPNVTTLTPARLAEIAAQLGPNAEVIADFTSPKSKGTLAAHTMPAQPAEPDQISAVLSMLKRRPCSLQDICSTMNMPVQQARKIIEHMLAVGLAQAEQKGQITYYKPSST